MIDAREDLRDSRGVGDHAARTHDLGQVTTGYNGWWLVVDAALEASWAPVHKLNGTLGLDRGHGRIHILWHYISLPNTECRHVCNLSTYTDACDEIRSPLYSETFRVGFGNLYSETFRLDSETFPGGFGNFPVGFGNFSGCIR